MKLLYFLPRYNPSLLGNRIHSEVIEAWRAYGIETEVAALSSEVKTLTSDSYDRIVVHQIPASADMPIKVANRALDALLHYPYLAGALRGYRALISKRRFDLAHIETAFPLGLIASLMPRAKHPRLAVTLPGADIMSEPAYDYGYGRFFAVRSVLPWVFRRADLLRADSPQIATLARKLGAPTAKLTTIPYNITADSFLPAGADVGMFRQESRAEMCARHHLDSHRPIIVSVNRLHPFKGFEYLIEALPHLRDAGIEPQVLIVGPNRTTPKYGDYGAFLRARAHELGVTEHVMFTGAVEHEQVRRYYAAADISVVASVAESFSRVAIEGAAMGTPVVITRTTGASDYVAESGCGLVVAPRDGAALGAALMQLLREPELWARCHAAAVPFAERFGSKRIAGELAALYGAARNFSAP